MKQIKEVLEYFPEEIRSMIYEACAIDNELSENLEEIRVRNGKNITLKENDNSKVIKHIVTQNEMIDILEMLCENSIYSYTKQIAQGFITIKGGHRVGLTGTAVIENGKVINMKYISSMNFRIARQKLDVSLPLLLHIINKQENTIYNTLIASPPGCGKTTMLRDCIRKISNGIKEIDFRGKIVGLVDEREEIAAMYQGIPQNDIGIRTDVISNISKPLGMNMLIRSMAPQIISCDEIGGQEDVEAINYAVCSGVKGIFTAHGGSLEDLTLNPNLSTLIKNHIFERIIFLDKTIKGKIEKVYVLDKKIKEYILTNNDVYR